MKKYTLYLILTIISIVFITLWYNSKKERNKLEISYKTCTEELELINKELETHKRLTNEIKEQLVEANMELRMQKNQ